VTQNQYFSGRVASVIHSNPSQAFYILKMVLDGTSPITLEGPVTIRGTIPGMAIADGSWFGFEAHWTTHKLYGKQLLISRAPVIKSSWDPDSAAAALTSHGVGERVLKRIRAHFGDDEFLNVLADATRLAEVSDVNDFVAKHVVQRWEVVQAYFRALGFLSDLGLPPNKVNQVWAMFGDEAEKVLGSNPWELVRLDGIPFQYADEIAMKLGLDMSSPNRIRGAVIFSSKNQRSFGHMYMTTGNLLAQVQHLVPGTTSEDFAKALTDCHKDGVIILDRSARSDVRAIYDPWSFKLEKDSADLLESRVKTAAFNDPKDYIKLLGSVGPKTEAQSKQPQPDLINVVETAVDEWGTASKLVLSEAQRQGVINALSTPVSILTGLPGTGKTTCLTAVVSILKDMGIPYLLCAPTGIAAKNLGAKTNAKASTIHRAFRAEGKFGSKRDASYIGVTASSEADGSSGSEKDEKWGYDQSNPFPAKVVIVDEASMLDQHLIYRLMSCTSDDCRLVIVGDAAQLPSVGPGNVLRDMINCKQFPVVALTEIFRQKDTSGIVYAAHSIHRGDMPDTEMADFKLMPLVGDEKVTDIVVKMAHKLKEQKKNFQVLSPRHAGAVGVTTLNARMRDLMNPGGTGAQEINVGDSTLREGDRIMVVKNDYELEVYNGDVGKVSRIDRKAKKVVIKVYGDTDSIVEIDFKNVGSLLRLAYACTVHKSQGLEYDIIIMPVVESFRHQLQRNLLYTAVTRARKKVYLIGSMAALGMAVVNDLEDQRNTLFKDRLMAWK
jgi:exodeoxyribonuclease V alpha subunit